jgi:hypothetical protein
MTQETEAPRDAALDRQRVHQARIAYALIYIGDAIRDHGAAIDNLASQVGTGAIETGSIAQAITDSTRDLSRSLDDIGRNMT